MSDLESGAVGVAENSERLPYTGDELKYAVMTPNAYSGKHKTHWQVIQSGGVEVGKRMMCIIKKGEQEVGDFTQAEESAKFDQNISSVIDTMPAPLSTTVVDILADTVAIESQGDSQSTLLRSREQPPLELEPKSLRLKRLPFDEWLVVVSKETHEALTPEQEARRQEIMATLTNGGYKEKATALGVTEELCAAVNLSNISKDATVQIIKIPAVEIPSK
jgi:hypothetical protein